MASLVSVPDRHDDPLAGLREAVALRRRAEADEALHVERAVRDGWSWADIAKALGTSRQAAHKKHAARLAEKGLPPRRPEPPWPPLPH